MNGASMLPMTFGQSRPMTAIAVSSARPSVRRAASRSSCAISILTRAKPAASVFVAIRGLKTRGSMVKQWLKAVLAPTRSPCAWSSRP